MSFNFTSLLDKRTCVHVVEHCLAIDLVEFCVAAFFVELSSAY